MITLTCQIFMPTSRYAFATQIYSESPFQQHQEIIWRGDAVQDRTIYEDAVFADLGESGLMDI